jgi:flagellar FliJ protein
MKKYKFKLDALLKIRKLKEETCKMEIGRIQVAISDREEEIKVHNQSIKQAFDDQEAALKEGLTGQELQFHPFFVQGKRANIKMLEGEIANLERQREHKLEELKYLRADVKVIDQMKEKDKQAYKKKIQKKMFDEIEEQVQNWKQTIGGDV